MAEARSLLSGTKTLAASNTAEPLTATSAVVTGVLVRALKANAANVHIGSSIVGATSYELEPGESIAFDFVDISRVFIFGKELDKVQFVGLEP